MLLASSLSRPGLALARRCLQPSPSQVLLAARDERCLAGFDSLTCLGSTVGSSGFAAGAGADAFSVMEGTSLGSDLTAEASARSGFSTVAAEAFSIADRLTIGCTRGSEKPANIRPPPIVQATKPP